MGDFRITREFVRSLRKAELHAHIEGMLNYKTAIKFAKRNGVPLPSRFTNESRSNCFSGLEEFLKAYYDRSRVLRTRSDFRDLATDYFSAASRDGVVHAEIFLIRKLTCVVG